MKIIHSHRGHLIYEEISRQKGRRNRVMAGSELGKRGKILQVHTKKER